MFRDSERGSYFWRRTKEGIASVVEDPVQPEVVWEQRLKDVEAERCRKAVTSPGFSFSAAGLLFPYHLGVAQFLIEKGYIKLLDPCGLMEDPSENQTGYGYAKARLLKWPALFIERVQNERLCRERGLKVPKARSVEIQKEDPDNVDRLCQTLEREISQMGRRLARDMQLLILKKDAQKNKTEPNVAAIKAIMEDPELVFDAELSDCSDSEPPADLSAN
ncbi:unnamed protein product [Camellia sinensis]